MGEEKTKFNLNQPLPKTEQEITTCIQIHSLLSSRGYMFEESPFLIDVLAFLAHKEDYFEEIVVEPLAVMKGDSKFLFPPQNLEEIILELNGYKEEVLSKMNDWPNGSTSTFPMSLVRL